MIRDIEEGFARVIEDLSSLTPREYKHIKGLGIPADKEKIKLEIKRIADFLNDKVDDAVLNS